MPEKKKDNLALWNRVKDTNPFHTKRVKKSSSFEITAIDPMYQKKNATEEFGAFGDTWGIRNINYEFIHGLPNNEVLALCRAEFFHPSGAFEISSSIKVVSWVQSKKYNKVDDDFAKKVETDLITKALSNLGFNADVFFGLFDDNKYVEEMAKKFKKENKAAAGMSDKVYQQGLAAIESGDEKRIKKLKEYLTDNYPEDDPKVVELLKEIG